MSMTKKNQIETSLIKKPEDLKYTYRPDIRDRVALKQNFRKKFEALNRAHLTDSEFARLRDEIISFPRSRVGMQTRRRCGA